MTKAPEFIQRQGAILADHSRPHVGHILHHPLEQITMPGFAGWEDAIHVPGDQFKQTLKSGIKAVEIQSYGVHIRLLAWRPLRLRPSPQCPLNDVFQIRHFSANPLDQFLVDNVHSSTP
jgi:hypothetical protein